MQDASPKSFKEIQDFDIEEVQNSSNEEEEQVLNAGVVRMWERIVHTQMNEKARARPYITGLVMFIWAVWTMVGVLRCATTGDSSLLIGSSLWLIPIRKVLQYYFS